MYNNRRYNNYGQQSSNTDDRKPATFLWFEKLMDDTAASVSTFDTRSGRRSVFVSYRKRGEHKGSGGIIWQETRRESNLAPDQALALLDAWQKGETGSSDNDAL